MKKQTCLIIIAVLIVGIVFCLIIHGQTAAPIGMYSSGIPGASYTTSAQTPWLQNVAGGNFNLSGVSNLATRNLSIGQSQTAGVVALTVVPFGSNNGTNVVEIQSGNGLTQLATVDSNGVFTSTQGFWTKNTNTFTVASTGWTNTNQFNCVLYITSATAATFTLSDGTNNIFTDTGLTFTTSESLDMHPSYKLTVSSGTITGTAVVQ